MLEAVGVEGFLELRGERRQRLAIEAGAIEASAIEAGERGELNLRAGGLRAGNLARGLVSCRAPFAALALAPFVALPPSDVASGISGPSPSGGGSASSAVWWVICASSSSRGVPDDSAQPATQAGCRYPAPVVVKCPVSISRSTATRTLPFGMGSPHTRHFARPVGATSAVGSAPGTPFGPAAAAPSKSEPRSGISPS